MTHELAHAYTHLGVDKDDVMWQRFERTDGFIAEGLAQYYTEEFLKKKVVGIPQGIQTFNTLLEFQAVEYKWHRDWKATAEQVYRAFIEARRNRVYDGNTFKKILSRSIQAIITPKAH